MELNQNLHLLMETRIIAKIYSYKIVLMWRILAINHNDFTYQGESYPVPF